MLRRRSLYKSNNFILLSKYVKNGKQYLTKLFEYLKYRLGLGSGMTIAFVTDTHFSSVRLRTFDSSVQTSTSTYIPDKLEKASVMLGKLSKENKIDCFVWGGDGAQTSTQTNPQFISIMEGHSEIFSKLSNKMPVLTIRGNHDLNAFGSFDDGERVVTALQYSDGINKYLSFNDSVVYGDALKTYGYVDNEADKIRVLFLNIYDLDVTTQYAFSFFGATHYRWFLALQQLNWLVNTGLNLEGKSGWNIVLIGHDAILSNQTRGAAYNYTYGENIFKLFISFLHKLSGSITNTNLNDSLFNVNVSYDFSKIDSSNKILCMIAGHVHKSRSIHGVYYYNKSAVDLSNTYRYDSSNNTYTPIGGTFTGIDLENRYKKNSSNEYVTDVSNRFYISCITVDSVGQPSGVVGPDSPDPDNGIGRDYISSYSLAEDAIFDIIQFDISNPSDKKIWCHHCGIGDSRKLVYNASDGSFVTQTKSINITVTDSSSHAIANAIVTINYNGASITGTTNNNGVAQFTYMPYDKFDINVSAEGYKDYTKSIDDINLKNKSITLTRNE